MDRMKASQEEKEILNGLRAIVFGSSIGRGNPMSREAFDVTPPRRVSPGVSPNTCFGLQQRGYADAAANVEMAYAPQPVLPQHYRPPSFYQSVAQEEFLPGLQLELVPDSRQRKLGIRPFDGQELYQGLGSGFLSWGKRFVRQVQLAERACGLSWSEDIKVDILNYHLTGVAERYYNRQIEGWWEAQPTLEHAMHSLLHTSR